jgi:glyoxalase family protein
MARPPTPGIHHVSAISGDPQETVDFYGDALGLRFVKRTVNYDDKFMYHLYFGDETGSPGTLATFFPYQRGQVGRVGKPQPSAMAFAVPQNSVDYWQDRLAARDAAVDDPVERFGETVIPFRDGDGQPLELVASAEAGSGDRRRATADEERSPASNAAIPSEHAIRGIHGVTLLSASIYHTASTLEVLGFELLDQEGDRVRYRVPDAAGDAATVDLLDRDAEYGREGAGTIHHVAVRAGDRSISAWRERLDEAGLEPTRVTDRKYFESVYAREPGGILFEVATDDPGLTVDEAPAELGSSLRLPSWFERDREMIEEQLPPIDGPRI